MSMLRQTYSIAGTDKAGNVHIT